MTSLLLGLYHSQYLYSKNVPRCLPVELKGLLPQLMHEWPVTCAFMGPNRMPLKTHMLDSRCKSFWCRAQERSALNVGNNTITWARHTLGRAYSTRSMCFWTPELGVSESEKETGPQGIDRSCLVHRVEKAVTVTQAKSTEY